MRSIGVHRNKGTSCDMAVSLLNCRGAGVGCIGVSSNRLIQNNIICWNHFYLARLLEKASDEEARENLLRATTVHTPIAWGHINFAEEKLKDALGLFGNSPPEIYHLKLRSRWESVIRKISMNNRIILEMLWLVSYLCSDDPNDTLMEILPF